MRLILASTSRYRAALLERLELPFTAIGPDLDETALDNESPRALVSRLSREKAQAVAGRLAATEQPALVIGSDQLAVLGGQTLGKPGTEQRARAQLATLAGREVTFLTGLSLVNTSNGGLRSTLVETPVRFRPLTSTQIAAYVERERPLDCAGAFKSEGLGIALFESIGGEDPNALIGLPLIELCTMLTAEGLPVLG